MTTEEKNMLLKDLCGRIPYGVKVHFGSEPWTLTGLFKSEHAGVMVILLPRFPAANAYPNTSNCPLEKVKPYLRPMESMTNEEKETYRSLQADAWVGGGWVAFDTYSSIDYLNSIHVDFRGMIDKDLAIAVTPENNPYNRYE